MPNTILTSRQKSLVDIQCGSSLRNIIALAISYCNSCRFRESQRMSNRAAHMNCRHVLLDQSSIDRDIA